MHGWHQRLDIDSGNSACSTLSALQARVCCSPRRGEPLIIRQSSYLLSHEDLLHTALWCALSAEVFLPSFGVLSTLELTREGMLSAPSASGQGSECHIQVQQVREDSLRAYLNVRSLCRWFFGLPRRRKWDWVEDVTGPPMLLQSVKAYNATVGLVHVKILEPGIIYPIDWRYTSQDWKNAGAVAIGCSETSLI